MTENYPTASVPPPQWSDPLPPQPDQDESPGTVDVARDKAADLGQSSVEAGQHTVGVAQEQASKVAAEASRQGMNLLRQAQDQLAEQAAQGQQRLADELLSLGDELSSMADGSGRSGVAADLARQAGGRARDTGQWLSDRRPAQVIDEVQAFARRRPGVFLAMAVGVGLAAGRLTRGLAAASSADDGTAGALPGAQPQASGQWAEPTTNGGYRPGVADEITYQEETVAVASPDYPVTGETPASGGWETDQAYGDQPVAEQGYGAAPVQGYADSPVAEQGYGDESVTEQAYGESDVLGTDQAGREGTR